MWTRTFEGGGVSRVIYTLFISPLYSSKDKALPADLSPTTAGDQRDYGANGNESSTNAPSWWRNKRWRHDLTFMIVSPTAMATMAGSRSYAPNGGKQQWRTTNNTITREDNTITHRKSRQRAAEAKTKATIPKTIDAPFFGHSKFPFDA